MVQWKEHQLRFVLTNSEYVPLVPLEAQSSHQPSGEIMPTL